MASNGNREIIRPSERSTCPCPARSLAALSPPARACSPRAFASGLDDFLAFNAATKTATARFEQQVFDRAGKVVERASGTFAFARPGKFRWTYDKPHKQVLVGDGAEALDPRPGPEPGHGEAHRQGDLVHARGAARRARTTSPRSSRCGTPGSSRRPRLGRGARRRRRTPASSACAWACKGKSLAAMELHDQLGGRTLLRFSDLKPNAARPRRHVHVRRRPRAPT